MDLNWQLSGVNMNESSMRLNSTENRTVVRQGNILEASSSMWDQVSGSENLGFSNVHHNESSPNVMVDNRLGSLGTLRDGFDSINGLVWGSPNEVLKGGSFFSGTGGSFLPQSLPHFAADSGFIERAARYSCFGGGNLGAILSPFNGTETSNSDLAPMQRSQEPFGQTGSHQVFEENVQKNELNMPESSNRVCLSVNELKVTDGSVLKNENSDGLGRSNNEAIMRIDDLNPDSEEAGFSGQGDPVESEGVVRDSSIGVELKKRKRIVQDSELDRGTGFTEHQTQAAEGQKTIGKKGKRNPDCKQGTQASDSSPKEDYIHVRARRGQATNSHSLAERVRREKISERMKFLQDLVPGCNKVTGKAVMLDEIINYVQSLQRQVEFLSMKLATVNPQLDCNLERLLAEDILQLRAGPSSSLPFQTEMPMGLQYHQSQGISQTIIQGLGNNTENTLRRSMDLSLTTTRGGYREEPSSSSHINTTWGDELHNAIQMGLISTAPLNSHDITGSLQTGHSKDDI